MRIVTVDELDALCAKLIEDYQDDIDAYDERAALQVMDDGKTTTQRAVEALQRPERFAGEHQRTTGLVWGIGPFLPAGHQR